MYPWIDQCYHTVWQSTTNVSNVGPITIAISARIVATFEMSSSLEELQGRANTQTFDDDNFICLHNLL